MEASRKQRIVEAKLNWSLNISETDDALYRIPRSSNAAALEMAEDQWCRTQTFSYKTSEIDEIQKAWTPGRFIEATLFLSCTANNSIELICHDPLHKNTSSFQIEANSEVIKMQVLALPGSVNEPLGPPDHAAAEVFGILLLLATTEGISAFSMVFRKELDATCFALEECYELSNCELQDINTPLRGRRVQAIQSKVVRAPILEEDIVQKKENQRTNWHLLLVVASSPTQQSSFLQKTSSYNIDAFLFPLVEHYCPVFRSSKNVTDDFYGVRALAHFQNLLRHVSRVKSLEFAGNDLLDKESDSLLIVLLTGELKLVPLPSLEQFLDSLNSHKIKVQTVLLSGVCAHPSLADLGEAVLLRASHISDTGQCNIAVLCRPKLDEIGFKSPAPDITISSRKSVSFSPVDIMNESTPFDSRLTGASSLSHKAGEFAQLPSKRRNWQTPKENVTSDILNGSQIITPESNNGDTVTPKKSNVSQVSTASSLIGLKHIDDGPSTEISGTLSSGPRGFVNYVTRSEMPEPSFKSMTKSTLSTETEASQLIGLDLVTSQSVDYVLNASSPNPDSCDSAEVLDLTGKWSHLGRDMSTSALSPLSGLSLETSADRLFSVMPPTPFRTPTNNTKKRSFGPGSALKKIRCTTPAKETKRMTNRDSTGQLTHVIILEIGKAKPVGSGAVTSSVKHRSFALPESLSSFKSASMTWLQRRRQNEAYPNSTLLVAVSDHFSDLTNVHMAELGVSKEGIKIAETLSCELKPLKLCFQDSSAEDSLFGLRSIAFEDFNTYNEGTKHTEWVYLRMLISAAVRQGQSDGKNEIAPITPINWSLTDDTRIFIASAGIPLSTLSDPEEATAKSVRRSDDVPVLAKLEEIVSAMQKLGAGIHSRIDSMDKRLSDIEEAMRTI